jgi:hypothetical protein
MSRRLDWEKANRKDIVHGQGGEPVWQDSPDAPRWLREEFSADEDPDGARPPGRSSRSAKRAAARVNQYVCSQCRLSSAAASSCGSIHRCAGVARSCAGGPDSDRTYWAFVTELRAPRSPSCSRPGGRHMVLTGSVNIW